MDPAVRELIVQLCTRAGMMMEDASLLAVTVSAHHEAHLREALARLVRETTIISQLVDAAEALTDHA